MTATSILMGCCFHTPSHEVAWIPPPAAGMRRRQGEDSSMARKNENESFTNFSRRGGTAHETCGIIRTKRIIGTHLGMPIMAPFVFHENLQ